MFRQRAVHLAVIVCAALILAAPGPVPATAFLNQFHVFFGNLHAHTTLSDGSGAPTNAFTMARNTAKLDFLAVTEHNHSAAAHPKEAAVFGTGIAAQHSLYSKLTSAANAADDDDDFVALFGQEFSTISSGNHMNVIGASKVIDENDVPSGDFKELYQTFLPGDNGVPGTPGIPGEQGQGGGDFSASSDCEDSGPVPTQGDFGKPGSQGDPGAVGEYGPEPEIKAVP